MAKSFSTFCSQTTLHGWQYLITPDNSFKMYFWSAIVCLSMVTAAFFLYHNTWDFINSNVVTTVDTMTAPLSEVFFPSLVACNINQIRESFYQEMTAKNITNISLESGETHQPCQDMFIYSKWNGTTIHHFEIERDFGTDYGICCWYTPQFNFTKILEHSRQLGLAEPDWGHWFTNISKGAKTGKDNGYTILFDIESFDYKSFREGSEGLKVALTHHLDMPIMRQTGFHISPGTENQIAVTATLIITTEHAMERFSPQQRDCYKEGEIELKYLPRDHGYRYEMSNCLFEATFENILSECQCFPGFHTTGGDHGTDTFTKCTGPKLTCVNELMNKMGQFDHVDVHGRQVKCRSNCEDQINSVFVTASAYPNKRVFSERPEFCILLKRMLDKCAGFKRAPLLRAHPDMCALVEPNRQAILFCSEMPWSQVRRLIHNCSADFCPLEEELWRYGKKNLAILNIFIKDPYAKKFLKDAKTTKTSYIANSGGILGLCMGFSLISGAEIIYHCLISLCSNHAERNADGTVSHGSLSSADNNEAFCDDEDDEACEEQEGEGAPSYPLPPDLLDMGPETDGYYRYCWKHRRPVSLLPPEQVRPLANASLY